MAERMTFPMYAIHRQQTQALWQAVQSLLAERGVMVAGDPPADDPEDLLAHWRQPRLLLSQTCGYPLVTQLPEVQTVGCFHYAAPGCEGRRYRSLLVVREADSHRMLGDFFGRRAACNAEHSQSGYNVLRKMVAPLSREGRFFSAVVFSGSHRQSLRELQQEAQLRLQALRERPPAGAIPAQFLALAPNARHAIAVDASRARSRMCCSASIPWRGARLCSVDAGGASSCWRHCVSRCTPIISSRCRPSGPCCTASGISVMQRQT